MKALPGLACLAAACLVAAGCSNLYRYEPPSYVVRSGDTLYSIAWRYGIDHRNLAAWNDVTDPDRIFVGQRLVLSGPAPAASRTVASGGSAPASGDGTPASGSSAPASGGGTRTASGGSRTASGGLGRPPVNEPAPPWQWPVRGPVVARFGDGGELSNGIRVGGRIGQPIVAAASGEVVYVGTGIVGLGQIVIIKHNETYLSAYGHNSRVLVAEGQRVTQGQTIAEMGAGPGQRPQLYFEIRRGGNPVDPAALLGPLLSNLSGDAA